MLCCLKEAEKSNQCALRNNASPKHSHIVDLKCYIDEHDVL